MTQTYDKIVEIVIKTSDLDPLSITPASRLVEDLGLDSVDMFDLVFALEQEFDIDLPIEAWGEESDGQEPLQMTDITMQSFGARIELLISQKSAA
ncbi:MAG: phosphopantetheine-binding protein [Flavimaricola sp.]|nr:phosphopantetheine-binding protein [Flavimaricola sp.]